jgi:hypothetical protein
VESGKLDSGQWTVESGEWRVESGKLKIENESWEREQDLNRNCQLLAVEN